jgi:biotin carboxyl carrier protein
MCTTLSHFKSKVGNWNLNWKKAPQGQEGFTQVEVKPGQWLDVRWRRDQDGIWLQLPHGVFGFDVQGEKEEGGSVSFRISQRNSSAEWVGVTPSYGSESGTVSGKASQSKATRVRAQMPGKIIRVLVEPGQIVEKNQPIMVMEAMKMENEIRVMHAGKVSQVKVSEGQAVETGVDLVLIDLV